jgi:hypothetical protein
LRCSRPSAHTLGSPAVSQGTHGHSSGDSTTGGRLGGVVPPGGDGRGGAHDLVFDPNDDLYVSRTDTNSVRPDDGSLGAYIGDHIPSGLGEPSAASDPTFHQGEGFGTVCVVQILATGNVLFTLVDDKQGLDIAVLVPRDNVSNVPVTCGGVAKLGLAVTNQEPFAISFRVNVYGGKGHLLCPRGPFALQVNGGRGVTLESCPAEAEPPAWKDPAGDVTLPHADILSGSATVAEGMVDLRVQFLMPPFPTAATHHITWCLDTDQNGATGGACGFGTFLGADRGFTLFGSLGALSTCDFSFGGNVPGLDPSAHLWFDPATKTLRLLFPLSLIADNGAFNYAVESAFGGSGGTNDRAPNAVDFGSPGTFFTSHTGALLPFHGSLCAEN